MEHKFFIGLSKSMRKDVNLQVRNGQLEQLSHAPKTKTVIP